MSIQFVDLKAQYLSIKNEIDTAIKNVLNETAFIGGDYVKKFEKKFSSAYGVKHVIGCGNGTDAIYISLKALGIGPGDEVITVSNTWISTAETISQTGARPVFIDINPKTYTIDVTKIEKKITKKTKAIIPVHLFGHPAEMDSIVRICDNHNIFLIEDCAQAHFAKFNSSLVGTFGIAGTFSFYPGKNLGAYGDAGAIISNDDDFAKKARMYANHGALIKHKHEIEGINSRLDGVQAAILSVKLDYIHDWTEKRINNAKFYDSLISNSNDIIGPISKKNSKHVFHLYVVRVKNREKVREFLTNNGISTGIHYPTALPFLKAYAYLKHSNNDFPVSYNYMNEILSLPMYPELNEKKMEKVVEYLKKAIKS
jgi:dTDP-4-amino-4,6-dideoxygalactose transaminase